MKFLLLCLILASASIDPLLIMFTHDEVDRACLELSRAFQGFCRIEGCEDERMGSNPLCHYHIRLELCGPCNAPSCTIPASAPGQSFCLNHGGRRLPMLPVTIRSPPSPATIDAPIPAEQPPEQPLLKRKKSFNILKTFATSPLDDGTALICKYTDRDTTCTRHRTGQNKYCCFHYRLIRNGLCKVPGCGVIASNEGKSENAKRSCFKHGGGYRCDRCGRPARGVRQALMLCRVHCENRGSDKEKDEVKAESRLAITSFRKPTWKLREALCST